MNQEQEEDVDDEMMEVTSSNHLFVPATKISALTWDFLLVLVFSMTGPDEWVCLKGIKKDATMMGFFMFLLSLFLAMSPSPHFSSQPHQWQQLGPPSLNLFSK